METKKCSVCNTKKLKTEFYRDSSKYDGLMSRCKKCDNTRKMKQYVPLQERAKKSKQRTLKKNIKIYTKKPRVLNTRCGICGTTPVFYVNKCRKCYISQHPTVLQQKDELDWHLEMLELTEDSEILLDDLN